MNKIHILPMNDLKEHDESMACACRPEIKDEGNGYIIIHNAYDGREWKELADTRNYN